MPIVETVDVVTSVVGATILFIMGSGPSAAGDGYRVKAGCTV